MYTGRRCCLAIYCLIEDELYPAFCQQHGLPRRAGFPPALSDSECLTVEWSVSIWAIPPKNNATSRCMTAGVLGFRLKDRVALGRQCAHLWQVKAWLHHHLVERLGGDQAPCQIIDTLPLPICHAARRFQRRILPWTESVGACPAPPWAIVRPKTNATPFKGGLRITDYGLIVHAPLLPAYMAMTAPVVTRS